MSEFSDWRDSRYVPASVSVDYWISRNPNDYLFYNTRMLRRIFESEKYNEANG